jgi:acyl-CoA reductase-like NAD-dependent aldehyde dehydrogenase
MALSAGKAPALMAGNAVIVKHASNVPGCALAIEEIFHRAGIPHDLFRVVLIPGRQVDSLIENRLVRGVSLTGNGSSGSSVARRAGELLKKSVLELGGSDPYLVLEDAAIESANNSVFGLGSCVISRDLPRAERIASELLEAGMAYVNHELYEDPRLPFGGIKDSGYGREMGSYGIKEFVNIKTVYVA